MRSIFRKICLSFVVCSALQVMGQAVESPSNITEGKIERLGGTYKVRSIERLKDQSFQVTFESISKTGFFDTLTLNTQELHAGVEKGMTLRLSADVLRTKKESSSAEISQVLLFLPSSDKKNRAAPVWIMSKTKPVSPKPPLPLDGAKYLEMHAPQSDFIVF